MNNDSNNLAVLSVADGKQYIVVAVSGGIYSGEYLAFALPNAARNTNVGQRQAFLLHRKGHI